MAAILQRAPLHLAHRWRALAPVAKDMVLAVLLTAAAQIEILLAPRVAGPLLVQSLAFAGMTMSVAWRRTRPLVAGALAGTALAVQTLAGEADVVSGFIALLAVTYSVASYAALRTALAAGGIILAGVFTYPLVQASAFDEEIGNLVIFVGAWVLGRMVRARQVQAVTAEHRALAGEQERAQALRDAIADERGRIARELHDIVAHGVSVMVLQSGAARQTLDRDPDRVRELLLTVETTGRQALDEMHRLLGLLRRGDDDLALAPPLTLDALDRLVADVRSTGLQVDCRVAGRRQPLPAGLEVSAYRIVQEALTNTMRHGQATTVQIELRYEPDALEVVVFDDGRADPHDPGVGRHGLIGMRERAELFGGSVSAGPDAGGGWRVAARLPIAQP